ncbi:transposase [Pseudomonas chengduensis]|jgi:putative transposase|uniref:Putative transposase n=2 Tax=Pseudomonadaceae TaxID=135621 RepID=A0A1H2MHJ0_9PSED|nr:MULTISPECIES: transposase [Pseudomonas]KQO41254.1 transposase [Pseudomonas sp. Leaf83]MBP3062593.1 transposase [Pseudomonas chengduensis]MDH0958762.1 transposase [Pseudomonas chengduensis]MDH1537348.1 transposase [Pseudomonas chengduensis]MDH1623141.1 transposase [Pseudomonas chengduensis]
MPHYRRERIPGATYFFTVTLADRRSRLLVEEIALLRQVYVEASKRMPFKTVAICVLPDHLHAVWELPEDDRDYSRRWALIKSQFSRALPAMASVSASKSRRREKGVWQRRFWEHRIRDEEDLARHVDYIHFNPVKHGLVSQVGDWPYSSFHRYVGRGLLPADWGGRDDGDGEFGE